MTVSSDVLSYFPFGETKNFCSTIANNFGVVDLCNSTHDALYKTVGATISKTVITCKTFILTYFLKTKYFADMENINFDGAK